MNSEELLIVVSNTAHDATFVSHALTCHMCRIDENYVEIGTFGYHTLSIPQDEWDAFVVLINKTNLVNRHYLETHP